MLLKLYTTLPASPDKLIGVRTWAPNCIGTQMLVTDRDTTFDKVILCCERSSSTS